MSQPWSSKPLGKRAVIYVGAWLLFGTFSAIKVYYAQLLWDKPVPWELAFRRSFKEILSYALCVLGVLWWCGRLKPWFTEHRVRWISWQLLGAAVFSLAHLTFVAWLESGEKSVQTGEPLTFSYLFSQLSVHYALSNFVEYWVVVFAHLGWQYYLAYRERERQAATLATELVQARLQALRMQINPHFLFNTLNTISALLHENPDAADRMIVRLSELFRRTLDRGDVQEVPLREELDFLRGYLEIEQMRFPDRLTVTFDIEPKANELLVPHLILQPLVENALRHGIMPREEAGRIEISARVVEGEHLELKVRDNGNGLPANPNVLPRVSPAVPSSAKDKGSARVTPGSTIANDSNGREGIGLKNIRSRLAQLYGGAQEFTLDNASGGGVEARIRIPCCTIPRSQAPQVVVMSATEASQSGLPLPTAVSAKPEPSSVRDREATTIAIEKDRSEFGGFWIRVGAYFVDVVVMLLPTLLVRFLFHAVTPINTQLDQLMLALGDVAISTLVWWVYTAAFLSSPWQATVGKMVCGLKVTDYEGRRITFGKASGRYYGMFLSAITLGIGFLMIEWSRHRQGLHDLMAHTLVLKVES